MVNLTKNGVYIANGKILDAASYSPDECKQNTMTYKIIAAHNTSGNMQQLKLKFDVLTSHDITYVGIVQTARASGLEKFPIPYILTNCHNSLCAVGGTINEDDHVFGLSAAQKYGGIYVPAHLAVIHQYMRECWSSCGRMILGSDSHTRYGALGTMAIGEGGGELAKQLLGKTYDVNYPQVVAIKLSGKVRKGVGPQDVALSIIGAVFKNNYVNNKVMEFIGDGIANLDVEFRNGIDVMTTETTCLSSIWMTDNKVKDYYAAHGRLHDYKEIKPSGIAYYDGLVEVNLSEIEPMIAMPCHPSNVYTIREVQANPDRVIAEVEARAQAEGINLKLSNKIKDGKLHVDQGIIAGCAGGTYDNIVDVADIIGDKPLTNGEFSLSVYPSSQPTYVNLSKNGILTKLMTAGAVLKTAFCGPCFGAGDTPSNDALSIRHTTRNFPNREGSKPSEGQMSAVALMDARSIAATAINGGVLTSAFDIDVEFSKPAYSFDANVYANRVYNGWGNPKPEVELKYGPGITDWPSMSALTDDLLLKVTALITDSVTTTDELIPSGETSSFRSNPEKLSQFTLSRKDPNYVAKALKVREMERARLQGSVPFAGELFDAIDKVKKQFPQIDVGKIGIGSTIYANKPGDGSAREQAASCQKVLGGWANIAREYATKRYRSNLINWGMVPFTLTDDLPFTNDEYIFISGIRQAIISKQEHISAYIVRDQLVEFKLNMPQLTDDERKIILAGCLINYYKK